MRTESGTDDFVAQPTPWPTPNCAGASCRGAIRSA